MGRRSWRVVSLPFSVEESLESNVVGTGEEERIGEYDSIEIVCVLRGVGGEIERGGFGRVVSCFRGRPNEGGRREGDVEDVADSGRGWRGC